MVNNPNLGFGSRLSTCLTFQFVLFRFILFYPTLLYSGYFISIYFILSHRPDNGKRLLILGWSA